METIHIRTLGEFSLRTETASILHTGNRTRKAWVLLAYLICCRGRTVTQKKLIEVLWGEDPSISNPENTLRITLHRARTLLNQLWPTAGHELILRQDSSYLWNPQAPVWVEHEEFEQLCTRRHDGEDQSLRDKLEALALYRGDFLDSLSSEPWVIPICTHFHNLYVSTALDTAGLLSARERHAEAAAICRAAAHLEPYHEPLHRQLIQALAASGDRDGASAVYEGLSRRLFDDFGIRPGEETREVYRTAVHCPAQQLLPMDLVLEHLQEPDSGAGALFCDYDYFKVLCHAETRSMARRGNVTHIVLLSVSGSTGAELSQRTRNRIMEQLGEQIRTNLRRGDVYSRCSVSQYIIMLPQANYENSCMVSRRLIGAFRQAHPYVAARISFLVQPLSPSVNVP